MSDARNHPEVLDEVFPKHRLPAVYPEGGPGNVLPLPIASLSKAAIERRVDTFLNDALEEYNADDLFVAMKQMEEAVKSAIAKLKGPAYDSAATHFQGETKGEILGHAISLIGGEEWVYTKAVDELKELQKAALESLKLKEQATKKAKKVPVGGSMRVTLRKEDK